MRRVKILINKLEKYMRSMQCPECGGRRLNECGTPRPHVTTKSPQFESTPHLSLPEACELSIDRAARVLCGHRIELQPKQIIAAEALKEIRGRLGILDECWASTI